MSAHRHSMSDRLFAAHAPDAARYAFWQCLREAERVRRNFTGPATTESIIENCVAMLALPGTFDAEVAIREVYHEEVDSRYANPLQSFVRPGYMFSEHSVLWLTGIEQLHGIKAVVYQVLFRMKWQQVERPPLIVAVYNTNLFL